MITSARARESVKLVKGEHMADPTRETAEQTEARRRDLKPLTKLFPYLLRYKGQVAGALFFLTLAAVTTLALPMAVRRMIDNGFNAADSAFINSYFVMLFAIAAILALASACRYYFVITLGERVVADIRRDVFYHVTTLSPAFFDRSQSGEIVSRLTADTTQIKSAVGASASMALRNTILGIGALIMMVATSPKLASLVIGAIPLVVLPIVWFGRNVRKRSRAAQDMLADATAYASESIGAVRTLQAFTNEKLVTNRFGSAVDFAFDAAKAATKARAFLTFFAIFMIFGSVVAVLWFGAQSVMAGTMSAGTLGQFLLYSVFAAGALGALSEVWGELSQASGATERLVEILTEKPDVLSPDHPVVLPSPAIGTVRFENVDFAYPGRPDSAVAKGLSFSVKAGETVAIVGPSGAGKSTVFSLLMRFYDPQTGSVYLDDVDVKLADLSAVRGRIAVVPQDVTIFAASAEDNIGFGKPGSSQSSIRDAARAASADRFVDALQNGYTTQLGERGITLSGGQRQRIAIARAVLKDAPILLLDEATSALDAESETAVQSALERLMQGRTTLIIAHRLATVLKADRILVMDMGQIVEEGTHKALVKKGGVYARLAKLQFDAGVTAMNQAAE
jgi:ATP-binding cassette, subfamily B, bacterial